MLNASPRVKKLMVAGAALAALGIGLPANANSSHGGGKPEVGEVGMADQKSNPRGQSKTFEDQDGNNGHRCDGNGGIGGGNPAFGHECGPYPETPPPSDTPADGPGNGKGGPKDDDYEGPPPA